jgi:ubiquinone/menaquinone biosynthesis C-methylase UbiE
VTSPAAWSALYDDPACRHRGFVFRRGIELASDACLRVSRPGALWLDAGCGPGHLAAALTGADVRVVGVDVDTEMLRLARDRVTRAGRPAAFAAVVGDAGKLPIADSSVDGVVATSLVGCLSDVAALVREAHRVVRPAGHLVMTFTNRSSLLLRLNAALGRVEKRLTGLSADPTRYHLYSAREMDARIRAGGFTPSRIVFYNYVLNVGPALMPPAGLAARLRVEGRPHSRLARNGLIAAVRSGGQR